MTDSELADRQQQQEFEQLFSAHGRRLFGYISACLHSRQDADEVFGETSLILWKEFPHFRRDAEFLPWAMGVALNQVRKFRRLRGRHLCFSESLLDELAQESTAHEEHSEQRRVALAHCVGRLNARDRELIDSFYGKRRTAGEVASVWGCTVHAVYKALKVTRRRLFECISRRLAAENR